MARAARSGLDDRLHLDLWARRHEIFCRTPDEVGKARIRAKARRAAAVRNAIRRGSTWEGRALRWIDAHVLGPYESTTMWLSSYTISATAFSMMVNRVVPGLASALLLYLPFALIPVFAYVWPRVLRLAVPRPIRADVHKEVAEE